MRYLFSDARRHTVLFCALLMLALAGLLAPVTTARAASITVNTAADNTTGSDTLCTLREAINNANADTDTTSGDCVAGSGADVITLDPSTNGTPITLVGSQLPAVTTTMTITGNGAANTIIEANAAPNTVFYRVFEVGGSGNLTLNSLTVRNGSCNGSCATSTTNGGGIYNAGTLTLDASTVSANTATGGGGGIYNTGTLTIQNGSLIGGAGAGNSATTGGGWGGGIYNSATGSVMINASTVSANTASTGGCGCGGGIFNFGGTVTIQANSTIGGAGAGNSASLGGGIFSSNNGTLTVTASTVSANSSTNSGGGIYNDTGATLTIQNGSTIGGAGAGNSATGYGGGIYNNSAATVDGSVIRTNTANSGGGIYNRGTLTIQNASIIGGAGTGNTATYGAGGGGGIYNFSSGTVTVNASTISANSAAVGGGGAGGAIYNNGALTIQNGSTIGGVGAGNAASNGGGIFNNGGTVTVDASTISANSVTSNGGGIFNFGGTTAIQNGSTIGGAGTGNTATSGGGFYNVTGGVTVNASTVSANTATSNGGAIYNQGTLNIQNGSVIGGVGAGNSATSGGGISNSGGATIDASTVSANTAASGGGIVNTWTLTIQNGSVIGGASAGNSASSDGAGILNTGTLTVNASAVSANTALGNGGGIYNQSTVTIQNGSLIGGSLSGNDASAGGGIYNNNGLLTMTGSRLLFNTVTVTGGAVYNNSSASVTGNCIADNDTPVLVNTNVATQTATGNWWGDPAGPDGTISSGWNVSGWLTAGSMDCNGGAFNLAASGAAGGKIDLGWADAATDETNFRVERSPDGSTGWAEIATPAANSTSYEDSGLTCWTPYYYQVRAYRSTGNLYSNYSNVASASVCAPSGLTATALGSPTVNLAWADNTSDETNFRVERSPDGSAWTEIATPAADSTSYQDIGVTCGSTYYYRVRAYRSSGGLYSSYTSVASAKTGPCIVSDGSLEIDANNNYLPDYWASSSLTLNGSTDGRDCGTALVGTCSMKMTGSGAAKSLFQSIYLRQYAYSTSGGSGQRFTFSVASKADSVGGTGVYQAVVTVYYNNNTTLTKILTFTTGTHGFETKSITFDTTSQAYAVVVTLSYSMTSGTVWFDNVSLSSP